MAMRVPSVLIKTDRKSASHYHTEKWELQHPLPLGRPCFSCLFTDNTTLSFMTPEPLSRGMNHVLVHNRENIGQVSGGEGSPSQGDGQVTMGSGLRLLEKWGREVGMARRVVCAETSMRCLGNEHRGVSTKAVPILRPQGPLSSRVARGPTSCANSEPLAVAVQPHLDSARL